MWWHYLLVFLGALLVDIVPLPLPPAFTVMIILQVKFQLNIALVIFIGVTGSVIGRYALTLYVPKISSKLFKPAKNADVQFLGAKLKHKGWQTQLFILLYTLLPLPTTPLFIAAGMAKMKPWFIIPTFFVGKAISDTLAVLVGRYAAANSASLMEGMVSWKSFTGLLGGVLLIFALFFVDWRTLLQQKHFQLKFNVWK